MLAAVGVMLSIPIDSFVELLKIVVKLNGMWVVLNVTSNVIFSPLLTNKKSSSLALIVLYVVLFTTMGGCVKLIVPNTGASLVLLMLKIKDSDAFTSNVSFTVTLMV